MIKLIKCCCGTECNGLNSWKLHLEHQQCLDYVDPKPLQETIEHILSPLAATSTEEAFVEVEELEDDKIKLHVDIRVAATVEIEGSVADSEVVEHLNSPDVH